MCVGSDRTGVSAPSAPDAGGYSYSFAAAAGEASVRRTTAATSARRARAETHAALTVRGVSRIKLETDKEAHPTPRGWGLARRMPCFLLQSLRAKVFIFSFALVVVPGDLFALIALARARDALEDAAASGSPRWRTRRSAGCAHHRGGPPPWHVPCSAQHTMGELPSWKPAERPARA